MDRELRGELKRFFSQSNLTATKYYDLQALRELLERPMLTTDETTIIWRILNLELWHREFIRDQA